jgi:hypothetical protein
MGEIKSTLDLVLERTSHLSMTPEEKARQREADFEKRFQGLLQQYADEILALPDLLQRMEKLQTETGSGDAGLALKLACKRVNPDEDNEAWLALLASLAPQSTKPLGDALACYREQKAQLQQNARQKILDGLELDHAIRGSAVLPNPEQDDGCRRDLGTLREKTLAQIADLCTQAS